MSFHRPPIMPGMPPGYMHSNPPVMPGMMPPVMVGAPPMPYRGPPPMAPPPTGGNFAPQPHAPMRGPPPRASHSVSVVHLRSQEAQGPSTTVFVGNISEYAPDAMVRLLLAACGHVLSWKRVQGASGMLQAFGFCEFSNPDGALRSIRLLHDFEIAAKKLVVKVDAKTKVSLDEYKRQKLRSKGSIVEESKVIDDKDNSYLSEAMKVDDEITRERINQVVQEHEGEIKAAEAREAARKEVMDNIKARKEEDKHSLDKIAMEEGKKDLISREIDKFREIMKKQEEEREVDKKKREKDREEREKQREREEQRQKEREERERERAAERDRHRDRHRDRGDRGDRGRDSRDSRENRDSRRSPSPRNRSPKSNTPDSRSGRGRPPLQPATRARSRSKDQSPEIVTVKKTEVDFLKEREVEEEAKERKKNEKRAREKEVAYQERLREWEARERKKIKEYARWQDKEEEKKANLAKDAKKLKQFLEDYDDDRDDSKYYKGRELEKRRLEREKEKEADEKDRQREKDELDALKAKIFSQGLDDPSAAFEKAKEEREAQYKPLLPLPAYDHSKPIDVSSSSSREASPMRENASPDLQDTDAQIAPPTSNHSASGGDVNMDVEDESTSRSWSPGQGLTSPANSADSSPKISINLGSASMSSSNMSSSSVTSKTGAASSPVVSSNSKKKRLDVRDVFNTDDDDSSGPKKRKLIRIDEDDEKSREDKRSMEEKRKHIKSVIDQIPTDKEALFKYPIEWSVVDAALMEKRIRPWINKKIVEYIGEPEPTLVEFICSKVLLGSDAQSIVNDVQMVLDEEAEVFVVKMWRLLIYEIEAKKLGLMKS